MEFVSVQVVQVDEPAPSPRAKYHFCTGPLKALDINVLVFNSFLQLPPILSTVVSFSPSSSHISVTFFIPFHYSHFLSAHRLCARTVMLKLALARWNTELSVTSALDRVGVQHVNTDFFFYCLKKKKKIALYFKVRCPVKYAPTNKSPLRSGLKRLLL